MSQARRFDCVTAQQTFALRPAKPKDVRQIRMLVQPYADERILIAKEMVSYYEGVQEFVVAHDPTDPDKLLGCGALHVMWEDLAEILYRYCTGMGILNDSEAYLFPAEDMHSHISTNNVGNYYRSIRKLAGVSNGELIKNGRGACLHCFRHTFAIRSFDKNERDGIKASESVPYLSTYLGHDSLYETEKYLKYSGNYFEDTLTKFNDYSGELFPEVIIYE